MKDRGFERVAVSRRAEESITGGHPWVYDSETGSETCAAGDGDIVDIVNRKGKYIATGFINRASRIRLRVLTRNPNESPDSPDFYRRRLERAVAYRRAVMGDQFGCCRLVFGESDFLPGLTVDRFSDVLVAQTLCLGIEKRKDMILPALAELLRSQGEDIRGIYERNDVNVRELEGMEQYKGWLGYPRLGCPDPGCPENNGTGVIITENGIKYHVDIENGQKTGFFLDQKYNRQAAARIAKGRRVLDCFTHTGSFALNCAAAGAESVCAVDISADAIAQAKRNAELNGLAERISFRTENIFDMLPNVPKGEYDMIILDPPAFTKSRGTIENAVRGYKEINMRAIKALERGGFLATCSCSHFMEESRFRETVLSAARDAGARLILAEARQQACDHPVLLGVPETSYLKFFIFQRV